MLKFLRQNTKTIIWMVVIAFALWGAGSIAMTGKSGSTYIGMVFGKKVPRQTFQRMYRLNELFALSAHPDDDSITEAFLTQQTWESLALAAEAKRAGVRVSDLEVQATTMQLLSRNGEFNQQFYQSWVKSVYGESPRVFEEALRTYLSIQKLVTQMLAEKTEAEFSEWIKGVLTAADIRVRKEKDDQP